MSPPQITRRLVADVAALTFAPPVTHVYNPLAYARSAHLKYLATAVTPNADTILLGMNPGPWGMVQTGVPFGEVSYVRDWMGIDASVGKPEREHTKRPVDGLHCRRSEVSGRRLWGWARDRFGSAQRFFSRFSVLNYCPLGFFEKSGRNRTPDKLPPGERTRLFEACDRALRRYVAYIEPRYVIGVGAFAAKRAEAALQGKGVIVGRIAHPSPANPAANRGWAALIERQIQAIGIRI